MPLTNARADARVQKAVGYMKSIPGLTVPQAMKLADFTPNEQKSPSKQMWIRRRIKKEKDVSVATTPTTSITVDHSPGDSGGISSVSMSEIVSPPKMVKSTRWPAAATQARRTEAAEKKRKHSTAFKHATVIYAREKAKGKGGMSAAEVAESVSKQYKVSLSRRSIQQKVKEGNVGTSPLRRGPKGNIPEQDFKNLCVAFESFVRINQLNGDMRVLGPKKVGPLVHKVIYGLNTDMKGKESSNVLLKRVLRATATDLSKSKSSSAEDRRVNWTNKQNLTMWLDNWERDIVELGAAIKDPISGKVTIPEDQLDNYGNFDETCLALNGSENNRGGRPEYIIYDPRLPRPGKATSKSSLTTTMITGSTAAGEAFPPHLQFQTKAQTKETTCLDYDVGEHAPQVLGKFEQEGRTIESYSVKDLDVLLGWHQLKITGWKKEQKLAKWKDVVESSKQPPSYAK